MFGKDFKDEDTDAEIKAPYAAPKPTQKQSSPDSVEDIVSAIRAKDGDSIEIEVQKDVTIFNKVAKEFRREHHKPRLIKGRTWKIVYP